MLSGRLFGPQQCTIQDIAEQIGVHWAWVSRHLPRAQARFAELLTGDRANPVVDAARIASSDATVRLSWCWSL